MAEDTQVADKPVVEEKPKEEPKKEVKLDSSQPLRGQVDKLLSQLPAEEPKKDEPAKPEEEPKKEETGTETPPAVNEPEEPAEEEPELEPAAEIKELPSWQKYILDNLPDIQTVGHTGNGKDRILTIKRLEDLPENFEFADRRTEMAFSAALASQEVNARDLLNKYQAEEQQNQFQEFKNQEAIDIQADIQALQKEGVIAKFQYSEDDPKFNDDPAVKQANAIYDIYEKTNDAYRKQFANSGRTYRISYRDAADKYFAQQGRAKPKEEPTKPVSKEREEAAQQQGGQGANPDNAKKTMPPGSTMQDVLKLYKLGAL